MRFQLSLHKQRSSCNIFQMPCSNFVHRNHPTVNISYGEAAMRRGGSVCSSARLSFVRQASTASSSSLSANLRLIQQHTLKLVQSYDYPNYLCVRARLCTSGRSANALTGTPAETHSSTLKKRGMTIWRYGHSMSSCPTSQILSRALSWADCDFNGGGRLLQVFSMYIR